MESEYDVIVIGSGVSGLCATIASLQSGAKTLLLEKQSEEDAIPNWQFTVAGAVRVEPGDEADEAFDECMQESRGLADPSLIRTVLDNSKASLEWLGQLGLAWAPGTDRFGSGVRRRVWRTPLEWPMVSKTLSVQAQKLGAHIQYETPMVKISKDSHWTVHACKGEKELTYRAKAVVLAAGGFQRNDAMMRQYLGPEADGTIATARGGNEGDGIRAIREIGAQIVDMDQFLLTIIHKPKMDITTSGIEGCYRLHWFYHAIVVDKKGKRFIDESVGVESGVTEYMARAMIGLDKAAAYLVVDSNGNDQAVCDNPALAVFDGRFQGDTIREVAKQADIDPDELETTVSEFNSGVKNGRYEGNPPKRSIAAPVDKSPFYIYPMAVSVMFTNGGGKINTSAEILADDDSPIKGIYATGDMAAGFFYHEFGMPVMRMQRNITFGRIAGANAATHALNLENLTPAVNL